MARAAAVLFWLALARGGAGEAGEVGEEAEDEAALLQVSLLQRDLSLGRSPPLAGGSGLAGAALASTAAHKSGEGDRSGAARLLARYVVDLDLPPKERWKDLYRKIGERLLIGHPQTPEQEQLRRLSFLENVDMGRYADYMEEYAGIVEVMNDSRVTMTDLLWNELGYEHGNTVGCTAVLAATANGTVFHGRNLDMSGAPSLMKWLVDVTFTRGGIPIAFTTTFPLMVGVHTAIRIGAYSVAQNTRAGVADVDANLEAARKGGPGFTLFLRRLVEEVPDFQSAVRRSASAYLMAPQYFTIAGSGPYEGALITRDRLGIEEEPYANVLMLSPQLGRWYIAQTNDDLAHPPFDERRGAAQAKLRNMTPAEVNEDSVMRLMFVSPVRNFKTVFTWVVAPALKTMKMLLGNEQIH